jgi:hypothetical protein
MLTVRLPEKLIAEIEHESQSCKISVSDVIRDRLQRASERTDKESSGALELIGDLIGSVEGLPADLSVNKKSYLRSLGYGENRSGGRRIPRRAPKSK